MRTFIFLLCTTVFSLNTDITNAQEKVKIDRDKVMTVDEVFDMIIDQTKYSFLYPTNLFENTPNVEVKKGVMSVGKLLQQTLPKGKFNVILGADNRITIKQKSQSQQRQITGKVTGEDGMPLAGVTVIVKGTQRGVATDFDGQYTITVIDNSNVLMFSSIGYASQEITVGNQKTIDVVLKEEISELDVIEINAGYYKTSQRKATGNISRVEAKDIELQPVTNPLQAVQGRMSGVSIVQNTGVPGGGISIQIRGRNSLRRDGNDALYVIDGVPYPIRGFTNGSIGSALSAGNPLAFINPNDIESFQVLKDADATAIYGSLGANGVVLITTKKGKVGRTSVSANITTGFGEVSKKLDLLNTEQYLEMRLEGNPNLPNFPPFIQERFAPDVFVWDQSRYTDWQEELIGGTAMQTNANVSVSGGNENTQFNFSTGYFKETTVFPTDEGFRRVSGLLNVVHTSNNNRFNINASVKYSNSRNALPVIDLTRTAVTLPPNAPELYDANGGINWENNSFNNPLAFLEGDYNDQTESIIANADLGYQLFNGFKVKASIGYNFLDFNGNSIRPLSAIRPDSRLFSQRSSRFNQGNNKFWIFEPQLEYNKNFGKLRLTTLFGTTFREDIRETTDIRAEGFSRDEFLLNVDAATSTEVSSTYTQYKYNAFFARINLDWGNKYLLNLTARRDGSSRFGPNKKFGNFGAIGGAWIFTEEDFTKNISWLTFGKFRGSYGITGNDQIGDYNFLDTYSFVDNPYNNITGFNVTRLANPDFSWESVKKLEFGLELGFFNEKILTNISWYQNRASDQLIGLPLSTVTGASSLQFNLPTVVENTGLEIELSTANINNKNFNWSTNFNLTIPRNKLLEFQNIEDFPTFDNVWVVGESINGNSGKYFEFMGINDNNGTYDFTDFDNNGSISETDNQKYIEVGQKYFGGIQNIISYKGFTLDFLFQFVKQTGRDVYFGFASPGALTASNQPAQVIDRWQQAGDLARFQKYGNNSNYFRYIQSDAIITDTSFIRLNNLSLSYSLPNTVLETLKMQNLRVFVQGQNLFTITDFKGLNPEVGGSSVALPPLRIISLGLDLSF
ncbi:TonB-dependent receptor [Flavivirga amylovorans]